MLMEERPIMDDGVVAGRGVRRTRVSPITTTTPTTS
jgi:hypothetical protein